ncbi:MAG: chaperonin 10-like protein [Linnemannia elongata]|nr:MAG: chaperonin 10-like protein [Linnemannia elongata]
MAVNKIIAEDTTVTFTGWASTGSLPLKKFSYHPRHLGPKHIEIEISHCGICGSDVHTITGGWGELSGPCVTGHEIVGTVVKAGSHSLHKIGDLVGVGALVDSCGDCKDCNSGFQQLCTEKTLGFNDVYYDGSNVVPQGGFADRIRVNSEFAYKIPSGISPAEAAPLLCAGITTYTPLKNFGAGPGKRVGVMGIGGLGHLAIQWAAAFKADEVVAISTSDSKREEAKKLGATKFVNSRNEEERKAVHRSIDILILTSSDKDTDWAEVIDYVANHGTVVLLALPEIPSISVPPAPLLLRHVSIAGSMSGGREITQEMLEFAAKHNVRPWITTMPMGDINAAMKVTMDGRPRYRVVLETEAAGRLQKH